MISRQDGAVLERPLLKDVSGGMVLSTVSAWLTVKDRRKSIAATSESLAAIIHIYQSCGADAVRDKRGTPLRVVRQSLASLTFWWISWTFDEPAKLQNWLSRNLPRRTAFLDNLPLLSQSPTPLQNPNVILLSPGCLRPFSLKDTGTTGKTRSRCGAKTA